MMMLMMLMLLLLMMMMMMTTMTMTTMMMMMMMMIYVYDDYDYADDDKSTPYHIHFVDELLVTISQGFHLLLEFSLTRIVRLFIRTVLQFVDGVYSK